MNLPQMPKMDVILTWPRNADYPMWRLFIRQNRAMFDKVIIAHMETNGGYDYRRFIEPVMQRDQITWVPATTPTGDQDWRNIAVNNCLGYSGAEWVWFTEQDFYPLDGFWDDVRAAIDQGADVVGVMDGGRLHPCSLMVKRSVLDRTSKNFGIEPGRTDHFGIIQRNLSDLKVTTAIVSDDRYKHYAGMSHNWHLCADLGQPPNYKQGEFVDYLKKCLSADIELEPMWFEIATGVTIRHG